MTTAGAMVCMKQHMHRSTQHLVHAELAWQLYDTLLHACAIPVGSNLKHWDTGCYDCQAIGYALRPDLCHELAFYKASPDWYTPFPVQPQGKNTFEKVIDCELISTEL